MNTLPAFFIQARLSSTRLYRKVVTPIIQGKSIIDLLIERIHFNFPLHKIYVLTTTNIADDLLVKHLAEKNITVFRGSEENVLGRFITAGDLYNESDIIRVCADNPFLLPEYLSELVYAQHNADYLSFSYNGMPVMKCHFGFFAERVRLNALKKVAMLTNDPLYLEHVTNYIYGNPGNFNVKLIDKSMDLKNMEPYRLTVDTPEDFQTASMILSHIKDINKISIDSIKGVVEKNIQLYQYMNNEKIKNSK